jgi:penicillin-binding protein 1C
MAVHQRKSLRFKERYQSGFVPVAVFLKMRRLVLKRVLIGVFLSMGVFFFWNCLPAPLFDAPHSTTLLDRNGSLLGASISADEQWRFPPVAEVPQKFIQAITCFEDRRFFYHPGVDPLAVARALWLNLRSGRIVSGASTITMQVIRLSRPGQPRTVGEKIIEMLMALRLEIAMSKKEILGLYAAYAPYGGNVVGIEAASWRYFGRAPHKLSWAETAMLAVLPNNPALIHPAKNRQRLMQKRNALLDGLQHDGIIDALTCTLAKNEPLPPKPVPLPRLAPHLLARVNVSTLSAKPLVKKENGTSGSRHRMRTTLIKEIQVRASEIVARHHAQLAGNGIHNAAALIMEVDSANVVAYVGNVTDFSQMENGNQVDIITAPRSTGSILKPLLYAAMLDAGELLPGELVADIPTRIGGFAPQNYSRSYQGAVPASMALARSLNVPAVRMLQAYGVDRFNALLKTLGMTTLSRPADNYGLSLILGGAEGTLWDLTGIYAGMARCVNRAATGNPTHGPTFAPPRFLRRQQAAESENSGDGNKIPMASFADDPLGPAACWLTLEAMLEVARPGEEGAWKNFASSRKIAWKTGTSFGHRDGWAVGVTPRYAVGVWVGNADGEGRPGLTGITAAAPILFELFGLLDTGEWFAMPEADLVEIEVCAWSGHRAGPYCAETRTAQITPLGLRSRRCPYCRVIHSDATRRWQVHGDCNRVAAIVALKRFVLPPAMEWYYKKKHSDYRPLPPYRSDCLAAMPAFKTKSLTLIYPGHNSNIYVPFELDGQLGRTVFEAAHRDSGMTVYWHLDEHYLGATRELHQMALAPEPGEHAITVVDENGERVQRFFRVLAKE